MPKKIIKDGKIEQDNWQLISVEDAANVLPAGDVIVPLSLWQEQADSLKQRDGGIAIWLNAGEEPESIAADLDQFAFIAINFPAFTDGRGYSYARLLRERHDYRGEIRAIGDVLQDQLHFMFRCGFSSYALKDTKNIETALAGFKTISDPYQAANDLPPLFRRRS
jgi:uncharacterized protein (DUF934 family)